MSWFPEVYFRFEGLMSWFPEVYFRFEGLMPK
mgnify:FL=1|jgi:hypothetical protein